MSLSTSFFGSSKKNVKNGFSSSPLSKPSGFLYGRGIS